MMVQIAPQLPQNAWNFPEHDCEKYPIGNIEAWGVYSLGITRLRRGAPAAALTGFQYTHDKDDSGALLSRSVSSVAFELRRDAVSRAAQEAYRALTKLDATRREPGSVFEIRALRIPAIYLEVMWLHPLTPGTPGQVIPYLSYQPDLPVGVLATFAAFRQIALRETAKLRLAPAY